MHPVKRLAVSRKAWVYLITGVVDALVVPLVALIVGEFFPARLEFVLSILTILVAAWNVVAAFLIKSIGDEDAAALMNGAHYVQRMEREAGRSLRVKIPDELDPGTMDYTPISASDHRS